jgi:8-oxo-dGTP diphosphatase
METSALHSVSVAAVITNDSGEVLIIQRRDNGQWEPPGGVLELGESVEAGLRRESREECGIELDQARLTGVYKNMARGIIALVFRARARSERLGPPNREAVAIVSIHG